VVSLSFAEADTQIRTCSAREKYAKLKYSGGSIAGSFAADIERMGGIKQEFFRELPDSTYIVALL
jgi:hypothetical protein